MGDPFGEQFAQGFRCQHLFNAVEESVFGFKSCHEILFPFFKIISVVM